MPAAVVELGRSVIVYIFLFIQSFFVQLDIFWGVSL